MLLVIVKKVHITCAVVSHTRSKALHATELTELQIGETAHQEWQARMR